MPGDCPATGDAGFRSSHNTAHAAKKISAHWVRFRMECPKLFRRTAVAADELNILPVSTFDVIHIFAINL